MTTQELQEKKELEGLMKLQNFESICVGEYQSENHFQ
jgi:hypothetical protein